MNRMKRSLWGAILETSGDAGISRLEPLVSPSGSVGRHPAQMGIMRPMNRDQFLKKLRAARDAAAAIGDNAEALIMNDRIKDLKDGASSVTVPADAERVSHTPGPWNAQQEYEDQPSFWLVLAGHYTVADCDFFDPVTNAANARLIAAAPDLLDALKDILFDMFEEINPDIAKRAKAAIAKADGRDV